MTERELHQVAMDSLSIGATRLTITVPADWKRPPGFPRCELLSVNAKGERNLSVKAHRIIEWLNQGIRP